MGEGKKYQKKSVKKRASKRQIRSNQDKELQEMLVKGEEVLLRARVHGALYWRSAAVILFAIFLSFYVIPLAMIAGIAGTFMLCVSILTEHYLLLVITNKRVLARYGLLQMDIVDIRLSKVESIELERMLLGHIFGYANVVVAGTGQRFIRVPYIANADIFRRFYNERVLAEEGSREGEEEVKKIKEEIEKSASQEQKPKNRV